MSGQPDVVTIGSLRSDNTTDIRLVRDRLRQAENGIKPVSPELHDKLLRFIESAIDRGSRAKRPAPFRNTIAAVQAGLVAERLDIEREKLEIQWQKLELEQQKAIRPQMHLHGHATVNTDQQRSVIAAIARRIGVGDVFEAVADDAATGDSPAARGSGGDGAATGTAQDAADSDAAAE